MPPVELPASPIQALRTIEITPDLEPQLQGFFETNAEYFLAALGEPAGPNQAHEEIHGQLPAGWSFTKKWLIGYIDEGNSMVAMANVVSDLLALGVWHIGLFIVATSRHGTGDAQALYRGLEAWAASNGATWLRLGVVQGNARAERFWESLGYIQTRTRSAIAMGKLTNTLRVMAKPLGRDSLEHYLSLVHRDRPEPSIDAAPQRGTMSVALAQFRPEHAEELLLMWRESFELGVGITDPHPLDEQRRYLLDVVVPGNSIRVALLDGRIVGFIAATQGSIAQLYVRKGFHHRGIGSRLLAWAKEESRGSLWLYTFERNAGARAFYEKSGFRIVARGFEPQWQLPDLKYEWVAS